MNIIYNEKAKLWTDENGNYFFRLQYISENEFETYRLTLPKVETGIPTQ